MIISEKQVLRLMNLARLFALKNDTDEDMREGIMHLLITIDEQQSEKLREIE